MLLRPFGDRRLSDALVVAGVLRTSQLPDRAVHDRAAVPGSPLPILYRDSTGIRTRPGPDERANSRRARIRYLTVNERHEFVKEM